MTLLESLCMCMLFMCVPFHLCECIYVETNGQPLVVFHIYVFPFISECKHALCEWQPLVVFHWTCLCVLFECETRSRRPGLYWLRSPITEPRGASSVQDYRCHSLHLCSCLFLKLGSGNQRSPHAYSARTLVTELSP